jgi:hypothetical protein
MSDKLTTARVREAVVDWADLEGFEEWLESVKQEAYDRGLSEIAGTQ